jgi:serine/threonine-protein kinase RsbW
MNNQANIHKHSLTINNKIEELDTVTNTLNLLSGLWEISDDVIFHINLAVEEILANIILYGYENQTKAKINIEFEFDYEKLLVRIRDTAKQFNPIDVEDPDTELSIEERQIGGLGIYLVKTLIDEVNYNRLDSENQLTLIKYTQNR